MIEYIIDKDNKIIWTNLEWDIFLKNNDGSQSVNSNNILGENIFKYIISDETRMFYDIIFNYVRISGNKKILDFRCDSPDLKRYMRMILEPHENKKIKISCELIKTEHQSKKYFFYNIFSLYKKCSVCGKVSLNNKEWMEPSIEKNRINAVYSICDSCKIKSAI